MKIIGLFTFMLLSIALMAQKTATVYTSAQNTSLKLSKTNDLTFGASEQPLENKISIFVNPQREFQTFIGIGGAITDAAAEVFDQLSTENQEILLDAYYSNSGINYKIIRTSIHSADFGSGSFTYIDEGDVELKTFSIDHDRKYRLPMIKKAIEKMGDKYVFYASPWSPPAFMKTNKDMLLGGKLLPQYRQAWANYYVRFIQAYENEGIKVWGLTVQNEPMAVQRWESCIYTAEEERDFVRDYLGPTLEKNGLGDKNIVIWDHNRDLLSHRANTVFEDKEAAKYIWGIGFHWYETWTGSIAKWENLSNIKASYPEMNLLFTEGCQEGFSSKHYQRWSNAERYGESMINDFNCGTVGWTDWNVLLNENGGPNHVQNYCFAPIHADTKKNELIFTPSYYYIGQFSKFIEPGAKRISTSTSHSDILATSFRNPDGRLVTVIMNKTERTIDCNFIVADKQLKLSALPHSIQTLLY